MVNKIFLSSILTMILGINFFFCNPLMAALPPGNAVKDPYAILRNALPIDQKDLREIQHKLEDTSDLVRGSRWPAVSKAASRSQFLLSNRKNQILSSLPEDKKIIGNSIFLALKENLVTLEELANKQEKINFIEKRRECLSKIGDLEALFLAEEFPFDIPKEFDSLPRLLGRADVSINTTRGNMKAIIDGYNAPLTAGSFIDLTLKGFYDGLPINRAEEFFVLQTGDPKGDAIGYIDPETKQERHIPLEIRVPNQKATIYNQTFEELGLYTATPTLPFATLGALGWSHSNDSINDGSSQFFFFLYDAELNPAGRNLIDGRNAAFGYIIEGAEILNSMDVNDEILSIKVLNGADRLKEHA